MLRESGNLVLQARTRKDGRTVKKVIALALVCLFTLSLVGCGGGDTKSTKTSTTPTGASTEVKK